MKIEVQTKKLNRADLKEMLEDLVEIGFLKLPKGSTLRVSDNNLCVGAARNVVESYTIGAFNAVAAYNERGERIASNKFDVRKNSGQSNDFCIELKEL